MADIKSAITYVRDKATDIYPNTRLDITLSKTDDEDFDASSIEELSKELDDIRDLKKVKTIELHAHSYAANFSVKLLIEKGHDAAAILYLRSENKDLLHILAKEIPAHLNIETTSNGAVIGLKGVVTVCLFAVVIAYALIFFLKLEPMLLALLPSLAGVIGFILQTKLEKIYPNLVLEGTSSVESGGRRLDKDFKAARIWLFLLVFGGLIIYLLGLN